MSQILGIMQAIFMYLSLVYITVKMVHMEWIEGEEEKEDTDSNNKR